MKSVNLYSAEQARELDRIAIEEHDMPGGILMERAGRRAFQRISKSFPDRLNIVVLCGSGNNGGDGYVVAECARNAGASVRVLFSEKPNTDTALSMYDKYRAQGGIAERFDGSLPVDANLIVDAMLGTGINRSPSGIVADMIRAANGGGCPIVALDVPSGLDSDTGFAHAPCIEASLTVTFIARKVGCYTADGRDCCGRVICESLDVPEEVFSTMEPTADTIPPFAPVPRKRNTHKRDYGDLAILGGSRGMLGAVLLAGRAALRAGCGLVTVASIRTHADILAIHCPELMSADIDKGKRMRLLFERCNALVIGPGFGGGVRALGSFYDMKKFNGPVVVDADALRILSKPLHRDRRDNWVLTPHPGEAAKLLDCTSSDIQRNRIEAAVEIAKTYGGICVLKGSGTVVTSSAGSVRICDRGNPGMATAGMGDVLSGIIGALLAGGHAPQMAAETGVWLHSASADLAVETLCSASLVASDVIDTLPEVMRGIHSPI
ncbi:MAG: NAD(P)H-hydrate dehydratase [Gammaproteobacteria bacterium]|nr:NAD(P)H-hydrate dehydratase [Gammaproteobacteria bacterium]MYD76858.1 NAD(P)H-hydrate dehydratase [Gammaproteobacteria bacterium]MYJ52428.1 NAD(P)H-hydrate dehydratase [Gammaproteobacteria bacterium]